MITILSQSYLSLDQYVDLELFNGIIDDIIIGISKSKYAAGPTNSGPGYLDKTKKNVYEIYREIIGDKSHPYHNKIKSLKNWEPYTFIQYKWPSHILGQCLILRSSGIGNYKDKDQENKCHDYHIIENFKSLVEYIKSQNIFSSIGRIVIFLNDTGSQTLEHRDYEDGISRKDQFVWISPMLNKKFYLRDDAEKIYVKSKFCYFDSANIHGTDKSTDSVFSIRVDGKFSDEFLNKTNLKEYFDDKTPNL